MTLPQNDSSSVLGIEIGSENTRSFLFDVVEGTYHFIAGGTVSSTQKEPFYDIGEGILAAISQLQLVTGRILLDHEGNLIFPAQPNGEGVDRLFITASGGPPVKIAAFGLLSEVSLDSANHLARTTYSIVKDSFGINDRRSAQVQMGSLVSGRPDIIIFAGGTNRGATRSVIRVAQMIALALSTMPIDKRPEVLYCGNRVVGKTVLEILEKHAKVTVTDNIRPKLELEDLRRGSEDLSQMVLRNWMKRLTGLNRIAPICSETPSISSLNYQRMIRFLGKLYDPAKGVLGIDLGSVHTTISTANTTRSTLDVFPLGMGLGFEEALSQIKIDDFTKWLTEKASPNEVKETLWQKTLHPGSIPVDERGLGIELAAARAILNHCMTELTKQGNFVASSFEPIFIGGSTITRAATPQQILLTVLDGIQPTGIFPLILDKHGLLPVLGAISVQNQVLPVHVMETTAFTNLATVLAIESRASEGTPIVNARLTYKTGNYMDLEIKQGSIATLPLPSGEIGSLSLSYSRRTFVEGLINSEEPIKVRGGICGIVLDARGRPLRIARTENSRREQYKRWMFMLGG
jgi:hypothetical protein